MPQINCHIPIKICVKGRPTDAQLEQLSETLISTLTARIAFAEKTILASTAGRGAHTGTVQVVRAPFVPSSYEAANEQYQVPSYNGGGAPAKVAVKPRDPRQEEADRIAAERQSALHQVHELLLTGLFHHWSVSDDRARAVLHLLQKLRPEVLLYTVMVMRLNDSWNKFRRNLPASDEDALIDLEKRMDPSIGYLMPGDTVKIEVYSSSRTPAALKDTNWDISEDGLHLPYLTTPVRVVGLLPQAAADAIVDAYIEGLIFVHPFVKIGVYKRGIHYAGRNQGPFESPIYFMSTARAAANTPEAHRQQKRNEFVDYISLVQITDPFTTNAVQNYLHWLETEYNTQTFLSRTPVQLWEWALQKSGQPVPPSRLQPFLDFMYSMNSRLDSMPAREKVRVQGALSRYVAWLDLHRNDPNIGQYDPVNIWVNAYMRVIKIEVHEEVTAQAKARAEEAAKVDWEAAGRKLDEALRHLMLNVWHMPEPSIAEDHTSGVGYLITGSEEEKQARNIIASGFLHDLIQRMDQPGFTSTSVKADLRDWLRAHPAEYETFLLAQSHPDVEKYGVEIDVPAWQTAVEIGVGLIPIVGQLVGAYEVVAGEDLFGHELSVVDRGILGIAILLPVAGKLARIGRGALAVREFGAAYRLSTQEAEALFRATAKIGPGSPGRTLITKAVKLINEGETIRNPQQIKELQTLIREMGMTDPATGRAFQEGAAARRAESEAGHLTHEPGGVGGGDKPPSEPGGTGGGGTGGATLLQRQRGAVLRNDAATLERRVTALSDEASDFDRRATAVEQERPDRAARLRQQAAQRRSVIDTLRNDTGSLRTQAGEFESGARSATADLPGPEDIDLLFAEAQSETNLIQVPLAQAERDPQLLPRLVRPLLTSRTGNRVVFRVEGGVGRQLVHIVDGEVTLTRNTTIHLNFGSLDRAQEFLGKGRGRIVAFEVDEEWVRSARSAAIPEHGTAELGGRQPRLVDIRFAEDQMEIPASLTDELQRFIIPKSGRVIEVVP